MIKKILFWIVLINLFGLQTIAQSDIIPLKKPIQSDELTQKKLLIDVLKPLPKPIPKIVTKEIEKKIESKPEKKISGLILPKKKPLIAGTKKTTEIKISKYYRKKDFALAKKAISEMKKANWTAAIKTAKRAKDKSIYDFIQWRHLLTKGNQASYYDYKTFIDSNEDW
jgi:soluble lytic murein transglycosylase